MHWTTTRFHIISKIKAIKIINKTNPSSVYSWADLCVHFGSRENIFAFDMINIEVITGCISHRRVWVTIAQPCIAYKKIVCFTAANNKREALAYKLSSPLHQVSVSRPRRSKVVLGKSLRATDIYGRKLFLTRNFNNV